MTTALCMPHLQRESVLRFVASELDIGTDTDCVGCKWVETSVKRQEDTSVE